MSQLWLKSTQADDESYLNQLIDFERNHKTWIVLNGGDHETLLNLGTSLETPDNPYPVTVFREPGLNHAVTAVGIIVPERLCNEEAAKAVNTGIGLENYSAVERVFLMARAACPLAR